MNETTKLASRNETTQLCTVVDRLQPPATAYNTYNRLQPPATAYNRLQPPTTAYNRLQPPTAAYNRLQPPTTACNHLHRLYSRIGFFYLLSTYCGEEKSWILPQDNATAHSALSIKTLLANYSIPVLDHPFYSPNLAPCDFYLLKSALKGTSFASVEGAKEKVARVL
ncbi:putative mariner transposase [Trichonephila clavipes]|nr:putative mariner transposase [Trichonephila clavipes]